MGLVEFGGAGRVAARVAGAIRIARQTFASMAVSPSEPVCDVLGVPLLMASARAESWRLSPSAKVYRWRLPSWLTK